VLQIQEKLMSSLRRIFYIEAEAAILAKAEPEYKRRGALLVIPQPFDPKLPTDIVKLIRVSQNG
jgi:hypothetical protein